MCSKYLFYAIVFDVAGNQVGSKSAESALEIQTPKSIIGDYVNYPVDLGLTTAEHTLVDGTIPKTDWRIFYKDSTYIYLIASNCITASKMPEGVFTGIKNNYVGYWPTTPVGTTPSWEYSNRFLFNGLRSVESSNANYKAATYMLNTNLWTSMVNGTYADAAIGGPTAEMVCKSWNTNHSDNPIYCSVNSIGYSYGNTSSEGNYIFFHDQNDISSYDTLYSSNRVVIGLTAYGGSNCWLSTPSANASSCLRYFW